MVIARMRSDPFLYGCVMIFIVLNVITLVYTVISAGRQLQSAECQSAINTRFLETLETNSRAAADYQAAIATMMTSIGAVLETPDERDDAPGITTAINEFQHKYATFTSERQQFPPLPDAFCDPEKGP